MLYRLTARGGPPPVPPARRTAPDQAEGPRSPVERSRCRLAAHASDFVAEAAGGALEGSAGEVEDDGEGKGADCQGDRES